MLTVMIKWNKPCQKLKIILSFFIAFSLICSVGAACLRPQIVCAGVAGTIAGYILTLFASFNTAITNPEVVMAINNTFGQMSMIEADAALIDQGIASIASSTGFDMASIFANTAEEAAQVIAAAPAGSVLEGAEAIAATAGVNIAAGAGACAASVTRAVLPAIGGIVLPATAAVALGIAGGFLINHVREKLGKLIANGARITDNPSLFWGGNYRQCYSDSGEYYIESNDYNLLVGWGTDNNNSRPALYYLVRGYNSNDRTVRVYRRTGGSSATDHIPEGYNKYCRFENYREPFYGGVIFGNVDNYVLEDGENPYKSPDLIGTIGNQQSDYVAGQGYKMPGLRPAYIEGENVVNYIDPSDYDDFMRDANQNTTIGDTDEDVQGQLFDDFIRPYISPISETPENPDEPENPEQKPTVPYPDPEEYPDAIPEVNPVPDTDIAPTAIPYPELPEPTDTEITETNDKITPFDLRYKFPFCLPFDIHKALTKLKGAREAPYFVWEIPFGDAGKQTVTVDLRAWDEVASILRLLELLLFIVGLAVATRNLIGGT